MANNLSTFAIAEMLHVDPGSVANWIDQDLLKAHRTPGGHRRVAIEDLVQFLRKHKMPVPPELDTVGLLKKAGFPRFRRLRSSVGGAGHKTLGT
jgi:hypothetical protein